MPPWPLSSAEVLDFYRASPLAAAAVSLAGLEELVIAPNARPRALTVVFLFGGSHERSCGGNELFPIVNESGESGEGRVRSRAWCSCVFGW